MKRLCRNCLFTAALPLLSGCLLINAALGVAGLLGTGPVQYASTAYTVGEYAYQYAATGKTPDEVLGEKLAELLPTEEPEGVTVMVAQVEDVAPETRPAPVPLAAPARAPAPAPAMTPAPVVLAAAPAQAPMRSPSGTVRRSPARASSAPTLRPFSPMDPLQVRMDRLETAFADAQRIARSHSGGGLRLEATTQDAGRPGPGVSGGWSIRHPVMQHAPAPIAGRAVRFAAASPPVDQAI